MNKRIAAIHDLSGFGKCSLTIILPILSACGLEACPLPTAFLSSHTGGLPGFTHRDLTSDLLPAARQWSELKLRFDGILQRFSRILGADFQGVGNFDLLSGRDTLIFVDPCMADNGKLYKPIPPTWPAVPSCSAIKQILYCPNLTEACLLLNEPYRSERYRTREAVARLAQDLAARFQCGVVLTGIGFSPEQTGAACLAGPGDEPAFAFSQKVARHYHGTGDLFASVFVAAKMKGLEIGRCAQIAADFVSDTIARTVRDGTDERYGVNFEQGIPDLISRFQKEALL
mgnify:CR=1 FL=1